MENKVGKVIYMFYFWEPCQNKPGFRQRKVRQIQLDLYVITTVTNLFLCNSFWNIQNITAVFKEYFFHINFHTIQYLTQGFPSVRPAAAPPPSRSNHSPWILKRGGLESSGWRLISLSGKTKGYGGYGEEKI